MTNFLFQLAVFAFIAFSFLLLVSVPVVFAYPGGWTQTQTKNTLFSGVGIWFFLVFLIGILNSFVV
uniref:Photosystem II reaction center protein Z n=1 Tax=Caulerpa verticillata TaxID=177082 RepID=A0A386B0E8_9CHLO|nr:photosystem II protein Z [Caulerpa verticillata]AYC65167.1 photosystem II protein Z [Caulerpa verticillata]